MITKEANALLNYVRNNKGATALNTGGFGLDVATGSNSMGGALAGMGAATAANMGYQKGMTAFKKSGLWKRALPHLAKLTKHVPGPVGTAAKMIGGFGAMAAVQAPAYSLGAKAGNKVLPMWRKKAPPPPQGFTPEQFMKYEQAIKQMQAGTFGQTHNAG